MHNKVLARALVLIILGVPLVLTFQNCGGSFKNKEMFEAMGSAQKISLESEKGVEVPLSISPSMMVAPGTNVTLSVSAPNSPGLSFVWSKDNSLMSQYKGPQISLSSSYNDTGNWQVKVYDNNNKLILTAEGYLSVGTSLGGSAGGGSPTPQIPVITSQPQNQTSMVGGTANIIAGVSAGATRYQWSKIGGGTVSDNSRISGSTTVLLSFQNLQASDAGEYMLTVYYDQSYWIQSQKAYLTVNSAPTTTLAAVTTTIPPPPQADPVSTTQAPAAAPPAASNIILNGAKINFKSLYGPYVSADNGGGGDLNANQYALSSWTSFTLDNLTHPDGELANGDLIQLRAANGQFVAVVLGSLFGSSSGGVRVDRWVTDKRTLFRIYRPDYSWAVPVAATPIKPGDTVYLLANELGAYCFASNGGGSGFFCRSTKPGDWERFVIRLGN